MFIDYSAVANIVRARCDHGSICVFPDVDVLLPRSCFKNYSAHGTISSLIRLPDWYFILTGNIFKWKFLLKQTVRHKRLQMSEWLSKGVSQVNDNVVILVFLCFSRVNSKNVEGHTAPRAINSSLHFDICCMSSKSTHPLLTYMI